jgi:putative copper export protein
MTTLLVLRWLHLVAAATWTGGLIVLAALVLALRRAGAERSLLQATARQFGKVSWAAMAVALATGVAQVELHGWPWTYGRLHAKLGLVALTVALALWHQRTAATSSPAARGIVQLLILLASLAVFGAAVMLRSG